MRTDFSATNRRLALHAGTGLPHPELVEGRTTYMQRKSGTVVTNPFLYLPVEVAERELDAKLLVTALAVGAGYEVIIGQKWLMQRNFGRTPPGIVLFKTLTAIDAKAMKAAHAAGHRIASIDEEIPGLIARNEGLRWVAPAAVAACDVSFAVGDEHLEAVLWKFPEYGDRHVV